MKTKKNKFRKMNLNIRKPSKAPKNQFVAQKRLLKWLKTILMRNCLLMSISKQEKNTLRERLKKVLN